MALTNTTCKNAKPKDKQYKLSDGGGLYLLVHPNGSKYWRMKYRFLGKEKLLTFNTYPLISLSEARDMRDQAKKLIANGVDPNIEKKKKKREATFNAQNTFKSVALEWHDNQKGGWSEKHAQNVLHRLKSDIFPYIGNDLIKDIEPPDLLDALRKIEKRDALEIASRARQICGQIFRYGIQTGRCIQDPSAALKGALKARKKQHFAALSTREIPEFLRALEKNEARLYPQTRRAIKLSMLLFTRPGELRQATWDEIDFDEKLWTIPSERMKMRRDHMVPLCKQAIEILQEQKGQTDHLNTNWVFPSLVRPRNPMSDGTVNIAIKRLGFQGRMTAHGFRALARTAIREKLGYAPDVIECQLAHKQAGPLGEAYNRVQFIEKRKTMMQEWADYIASQQKN